METGLQLQAVGPGDSGPITNQKQGGIDMSVKRSVLIAMAAVIVLGAGFAAAQTSTYEIKQGTVVHVYGNNLVVKMSTGEVKEFDVPEGFMFNIDGKEVPVSELVPGTMLTSVVTTTTTPHVVQTTELRNAEIVQRQGRNVIFRDENGKLRLYKDVSEDLIFTVDGKQVPYKYLAGGMRVTATLVHTSVTEVTEQDVNVMGQAPAKPKPAPMPAAAPAPAPDPVLPKTASSLPLAGLGGIALLILAIGIAVIRRF